MAVRRGWHVTAEDGDELGFAPLDNTGAQLPFRFMAAAYERRALGLGLHWLFESWGRRAARHFTQVSYNTIDVEKIWQFADLVTQIAPTLARIGWPSWNSASMNFERRPTSLDPTGAVSAAHSAASWGCLVWPGRPPDATCGRLSCWRAVQVGGGWRMTSYARH